MELMSKIMKQMEVLYQLDVTLNSLYEEYVNKVKNLSLKKENEDLAICHQLYEDDKLNYKIQIKKLELKVNSQNETILKLRKNKEEIINSKEIKKKEEEEKKVKNEKLDNISKILVMGIIKNFFPSLSKEMSK